MANDPAFAAAGVTRTIAHPIATPSDRRLTAATGVLLETISRHGIG